MNAYLKRILDTLGDQDPIVVLNSSVGRLEHLLLSLDELALDCSYAPNKWTAKEIICHMADVEYNLALRIRQTVLLNEQGQRYTIDPFDQDLWASRYTRMDAHLAFSAFMAMRLWTLAFLSGLNMNDWLAEATHPERPEEGESVDTMVRFLAGHDLNHLKQLEAISKQGTLEA